MPLTNPTVTGEQVRGVWTATGTISCVTQTTSTSTTSSWLVADHSGSDSLQMDPTTGVWLAQRYTATGIPYSHTTGTPTLVTAQGTQPWNPDLTGANNTTGIGAAARCHAVSPGVNTGREPHHRAPTGRAHEWVCREFCVSGLA